MIINRPQARLTMDVLSPEALTHRIRNSDRDESFIAISSEKIKEARFLAVMMPESKPASGDFAPRPQAKRIDSNGWIGAVLNDSLADYYGFFRTDASASSAVQGFNTDASRFTAAVSGGKLTEVYFEGKNFEGYGLKLGFTVPVSASVVSLASESVLEIKSAASNTLSLSGVSKPVSLTLNGNTYSNWKYDQNNKMISITVPAGQSGISIKVIN